MKNRVVFAVHERVDAALRKGSSDATRLADIIRAHIRNEAERSGEYPLPE